MQLYKHLQSKGFSEPLQLWLGSSLVNSKSGGLDWTFNIEGAAAMYEDYQAQEFWDVVAAPPAGVQLNIVRAENSDRYKLGSCLKWTADVNLHGPSDGQG